MSLDLLAKTNRTSHTRTVVSKPSEDGFYTLNGILPGIHTLVFSKAGFVDFKTKVVVEGNINAGGAGDVSMTPKLKSGEWRAVLKWGAKPLDLDAYSGISELMGTE